MVEVDSEHHTELEDLDDRDQEYVPGKIEDEETVSWEPGVNWRNLLTFGGMHCLALYALTLIPSVSPLTLAFTLATLPLCFIGLSAGVHRLWSHRAYKAKYPLRLFLMYCMSMINTYTGSVYSWCQDHRLHHKYSDTIVDSINPSRGLFFAHCGWLMLTRHPANVKATKAFRMPDLERDPMVMFQHRYHPLCFLPAAFIIPTLIPHLLWGENLIAAVVFCALRCEVVNHFSWLINSAGHSSLGMKPYDTNMAPTDSSFMDIVSIGDGYHNFHHAFPYDYSSSEWGLRHSLSTQFINLMGSLGQAHDMKVASPRVIAARVQRTGNMQIWKEMEGKKAV